MGKSGLFESVIRQVTSCGDFCSCDVGGSVFVLWKTMVAIGIGRRIYGNVIYMCLMPGSVSSHGGGVGACISGCGAGGVVIDQGRDLPSITQSLCVVFCLCSRCAPSPYFNKQKKREFMYGICFHSLMLLVSFPECCFKSFGFPNFGLMKRLE